MKKFYTFALAAGIAASLAAQQAPEQGQYYYLVSGYQGNSTANEVRPNSCFGIRTQTEGDYYGAQPYTAGDAHELWTFVQKPGQAEGETALYALVNKAGEYVPALNIVKQVGASATQDARYEVTALEGDEIPADAYAFTIDNIGTITEANLSGYDATIHGMQAGDTYLRIKPVQYYDGTAAVDNSGYYLNLAGNGRQFAINLWTGESGAPAKSQDWILVPEQREVTPEPEPDPTPDPEPDPELVPALGLEDATYIHLVTGFKGNYTANELRPNACLGVKADGTVSYFATGVYAAEDLHQLWTIVANPNTAEGETPLYALVNKAGEYIPALGILTSQNGQLYQDTRYEVKSAAGVALPDDAYGFSVEVAGTLTEDNLTNYDATTLGLNVGDTYITIKPANYCNNRQDPEAVAENTGYYLNAAAKGRDYYINLWSLETPAPYTSQYWIIAGAPQSAPATPEVTTDLTIADGVVTIEKGGSASITITAEEGAQVAYAFLYEGEDEPYYTVSEGNVAVLLLDEAGILMYYAVRGELSSEVSQISIIVDDSSSISAVEAANAPAAIYDLQGRKVAAPAHGLYIINGKKTLVK